MRNVYLNVTRLLTALMFCISLQPLFGQNGVAIAAGSSATADNSAMLDVQSSSKGVLIPRMTNALRGSISAPANGLLVFCTDAPSGFYYNSGTSGSPVWVLLSAGALSGTGTTNQHAKWTGSSVLGNAMIFDNGTSIGIGSGSPAALIDINANGSLMTAAGATSAGGNVNITAQNGGSTSGNGGSIILTPGTTASGTAGGVGIGTTTVPHGGIGDALLAINGPDQSNNGPHVEYTTSANNYPVFQQLNWTHDNVQLNFDAAYNTSTGYLASSTTAPFQILKQSGVLNFNYAAPTTLAGAFSFTTGMNLNSSGEVGIGIASAIAPLEVNSVTTSNLGNGLVDFLQPNLVTGGQIFLKLGVALSNYNEADLTYNYVGSGLGTNNFSIGFYGTGAIASFAGNGNVTIPGLVSSAALASAASNSNNALYPVYATSTGQLVIASLGLNLSSMARVPFNYSNHSSVATTVTTNTYTTNNLNNPNNSWSWTCPSGITQIYVKLWGAGGGDQGGAGGFVSGWLPVTAGSTYYVIVGQGGYRGSSTVECGGGGVGQTGNSGSGGGRSAIRLSSGTVDLVTAGGGGGGNTCNNAQSGGAGGNTIGGTAGSAVNVSSGCNCASQTTAASGGSSTATTNAGAGCPPSTCSGSTLGSCGIYNGNAANDFNAQIGGAGPSSNGAGGGGGGWCGGGGGNEYAGGGGGSNYTGGLTVIANCLQGNTSTSSTRGTPPMTTDSDYSFGTVPSNSPGNCGTGGNSGSDGADGYVVIYY